MAGAAQAPRQPVSAWRGCARGAWLVLRPWQRALVVSFALISGGVAAAADVVAARYLEPTSRYAHGVLGDAIEYGALEIEDRDRGTVVLRLPEHRVFEDTAPRVVDATGDGVAEVVVVESDRDRGARLAIYTAEGLLGATPFIGTRFRWLAPVAIADLDGDGAIELAYVDRPHLAKTLRVWRFLDGGLTEVARLPGVTNHRIGEDDIAGGLRTCAGVPELIVADARWQRLLAVRLVNGSLESADIGPHDRGRASFSRALNCE